MEGRRSQKPKRRLPFDHGPFPLVDHWRSHRNVDCLSEIVMPPDFQTLISFVERVCAFFYDSVDVLDAKGRSKVQRRLDQQNTQLVRG